MAPAQRRRQRPQPPQQLQLHPRRRQLSQLRQPPKLIRPLRRSENMCVNPQLAAVIEKYRSHPEFLGLDIVDPSQPGAVNDTLLHLVSRIGAVEDIEILASAGAEINAIGDLGNTPLHQAAMRGQVASTKKLLTLGANRDLTNEFGQTALTVAELSGHNDIVRILRHKS